MLRSTDEQTKFFEEVPAKRESTLLGPSGIGAFLDTAVVRGCRWPGLGAISFPFDALCT